MTTLYTEQTWADDPGGGTPILAATLTHMEDGIYAAASRALQWDVHVSDPMIDVTQGGSSCFANNIVWVGYTDAQPVPAQPDTFVSLVQAVYFVTLDGTNAVAAQSIKFNFTPLISFVNGRVGQTLENGWGTLPVDVGFNTGGGAAFTKTTLVMQNDVDNTLFDSAGSVDFGSGYTITTGDTIAFQFFFPFYNTSF